MIAIIAAVRVKTDRLADFERDFLQFAADVRANENGNLLFQLCGDPKRPGAYKIMELYDSEDALKAHSASAHAARWSPVIAALLDGAPEIQKLNVIG
ncbi:putative quinol monooxygenase [Sphingopyxis kveilinensis]|uniref:putative quinol monooxygenase n=1 Tax=Sphingopyxis kveilinensis TaxID=3114367 RepID=UPI0030D2866D